MISLSLPYPPSTNQLYRTAGYGRDGKRRGRIKTQRYLTWLRAAGNEVLAQRQKPLRGPVVLAINVRAPDKRRRDISNLIKAVEDLLVEHGLIQDDSNVAKLIVERNPYLDKGECIVEVYPAALAVESAA